MKIRKIAQGMIPSTSKILTEFNESKLDTYSCNTINSMLNTLESNDPLPIGTILDFEGDEIPEGYGLVEDKPSNTYSTEEQVVGTWIDDKPIYQKTVQWSGSLELSMTIPHDITELDKVIDFDIVGQYDGNYLKIPFLYGSGANTVGAYVTSSGFHIRNETPHNYTYIFCTIRYTKTTD